MPMLFGPFSLSAPVLIGPFETRPVLYGTPHNLVPSRSIEKAKPFETRQNPADSHLPVVVDQPKLSSDVLRSLLQARMPRRATPSQMQEITATVQEAIRKARDILSP